MGRVAGNGRESDEAIGGRTPAPAASVARQSGAARRIPARRRARWSSPARSAGRAIRPPPAVDPDPIRIVEILSHELRSPITTIHLGTKVLAADHGDIPAPVRTEVVEAVEEEAERLYRLVEDLLAVARHEAGANPLPVAADPAPALARRGHRGRGPWRPPPPRPCRGPVRPAAGARRRGGPGPRRAQPARQRRALRGRRHAGRGRGHPPARRGTSCSTSWTTGRGSTPDEAERLFEPFYRAPAVDALGSGAGLGLAAAPAPDAGDGRRPRGAAPRRRRRAVPRPPAVAAPGRGAGAEAAAAPS